MSQQIQQTFSSDKAEPILYEGSRYAALSQVLLILWIIRFFQQNTFTVENEQLKLKTPHEKSPSRVFRILFSFCQL